VTRRVARPLMSAFFVASGVAALRHPEPLVQATRAAGLSDAEKLVKVQAANNLVGGLALATGKLPRVAALALAAGLVPATYVQHPFWSAAPQDKQAQQASFLKNLGLLGGLLIAAADTGGRESIPHALGRVSRKATKDASKAQRKAVKQASKKADKVKKSAGDLLPV
jgi:putative oxidoreductase